MLAEYGAARPPTVESPSVSRATMSRRVGSARAAKARESWSVIRSSFFNHSVDKNLTRRAAVVNRTVEDSVGLGAGERLRERGLEGCPEGRLAVAVDRDHVAQDRERVTALGLGVDGLDVQHLACERDGQQAAEHDPGVAATL